MTDKKIISALDSCDVFSKASDATYKELLSCSPKHFNPGELIYSAESFEKNLGIIVFGKVEVYGETGNRRVRLNTLSHGDMFGAAALFGKDSGYVSTVISKTASDVLFVSESKVKELITSDSQVALAYISFLSDRIRFLPIRGEDAGYPVFITYYKNLEQTKAFSAFLKLLEGEE